MNLKHVYYFLTLLILMFSGIIKAQQVDVSGTKKMWYPITITIDGPSVNESESTFRNYRLDVTFTKGTKTFKVPGFFAADGNAAETSATSGNKWRAIFTPNEVGTWNYTVSLRTGTDIAISLVPTAGSPIAGDGASGSFTVIASGSNEPGFFAKGKLNYVGEHYGQFEGNKEWYVKAGPGSPEDFFGYYEFDNTVDGPNHSSSTQQYDQYLVNGLHRFPTHVNDWATGDPTWKSGKGKGIIGALNYLSSIGANTLYLIPFTINDDSDNTWPWTSRDAQMSYDVSKLAQWDIVFSHMDKMGITPLYYLCESDNSKLLDNGDMTLKNPIYYREVIARFGYHLGMRFNLGEELKQTCDQQKAASKWLKDLDPYNIIVVGHGSHQRSTHVPIYNCLLGTTSYDGPNYQLHQNENRDHLDLIMWRDLSAQAGHKWIVANDESWKIDNSTGSDGEGRMIQYVWKTFMAGAEGFVQYTGYEIPEIGDITMENFRLIENTQKILIATKELFQKPEVNPHLPQMKNMNALVDNTSSNEPPYCFGKTGEVYIIYRPSSSAQKPLNLAGVSGQFTVKWYNGKTGGDFVNGSVTTISGGGSINLGNPPNNANAPWAIVVYKDNACTDEKTITLSVGGYAGSTVSGAGKYCANKTASVSANVSADAEFVNWTENGTVVSTNNPYSFTVTANRSLVANFVKRTVVEYTINIAKNPSSGGTTTGTGTYSKDATVSLTATADACYVFENWTENGNVVSSNASYTFIATSNRDLVANFKSKVFTVIAEPGGTVSGELNYVCGAVINVTATPNEGYKFIGWYANDTPLSTNPTDDINIGSAFQLKAKFASISGCLPWSAANFNISATTVNYSSGAVDISCASAVKLSLNINGTNGVMETNQDYLKVSYRVNGGATVLAKEIWGNFSAQDVVVQGISGSTLELIINGYTSATTEVYSVSNSSIVSDGGTTNIPVTGVTIDNCPTANLVVGGTVDLASTISPTNATNPAVSWSSSNTAIATVDASTGLVTAKAVGTATITVKTTDGNKTTSCGITVNGIVPPACSLPWSAANFNISATTVNYSSGAVDISCASAVKLSLNINGTNGVMETNQDYLKVSYRVNGGATVLAKEIWGNFPAQDVVVQGIIGSTLELIINGYTSATTEIYSVSNSSIVSDGGTTNVPVTGVTISNCPAANLVVGGTVDLASTIAPANATNKAVVWSSSNTTVATVDVSNGLVTALAAGTAVMTVETGDGNKTATCTINVDSAPVCSNWTDANFSVTNTTKNYNSGLIDISCASSVTLSMDISENSSLENEDVVKVSYILDNNAEVVFWNQMNDFAPKAISIPNLSGSKITVKVYVITNDSQETINVSNLKITIDGLKSASASSGAKISQSQETLSVNEKLLSSTMVKVYPNPVSGTLNINSEGSSENVINVFNALGQLVFSTKSNKTDTQIDIQSLNLSGVVIVQVIADGTVSNHKVIVK